MDIERVLNWGFTGLAVVMSYYALRISRKANTRITENAKRLGSIEIQLKQVALHHEERLSKIKQSQHKPPKRQRWRIRRLTQKLVRFFGDYN